MRVGPSTICAASGHTAGKNEGKPRRQGRLLAVKRLREQFPGKARLQAGFSTSESPSATGRILA